MALKPGSTIPDVTLTHGDSRTTVALRDYLAEGPLVVLFYPMAFSSTCTEELCTVADDYSAYHDLGATIVAISVDSPYVAARFAAECGATFPFLSDFNRTAARAFRVLRHYLGELEGVSERAAFVSTADGVITYAWVGEHPGVLPPLQEIKQALLTLR